MTDQHVYSSTTISALRGLRITPDGVVETVAVGGGEQGRLAAMYTLIGCRYVDVVRLAGDLDMWVDDEGMMAGAEMNPTATIIAAGFGFDSQPYFGTVLFLGGANDEGDSLPLSPGRHDQVDRLARRCAVALRLQP